MSSLPFLRNLILFLEDSMNYFLERYQIRIPHDDVVTLQYVANVLRRNVFVGISNLTDFTEG